MRKYMMAGNWKMNKTIPEAIALTQQLCNYYNRAWDKVEVVLCVPAIDIRPVQTVIDFDKTDIEVAAQNVYFEPSGAYTGRDLDPDDQGCGLHLQHRRSFRAS